jgi:GntR family transcriptional regulator
MRSPITLYESLKETISGAIAKGEISPGEQLPSQRELSKRYAMSHMTVRRAINELVQEGIIHAIPGKGLFAAQRTQAAEVGSLLSFGEQMARLGLEPSTLVLEAKIIGASGVLAKTLEVNVDTPLVYLRRLRLANGQPLAHTLSYLPHTLCPGLLEYDLEHHSLFTILRDVYKLQLVKSQSVISATLASEEEARLFDMTLPAALLVREQTTFLARGQAIEFSHNVLRADQYHLQVEEQETAHIKPTQASKASVPLPKTNRSPSKKAVTKP